MAVIKQDNRIIDENHIEIGVILQLLTTCILSKPFILVIVIFINDLPPSIENLNRTYYFINWMKLKEIIFTIVLESEVPDILFFMRHHNTN